MDTLTRSSGKEFVEFWTEYAAKRGLMSRSTAETIKSAAKVVLSTVEPEAWEELDVQTIDVDSFLQRFERLKMTELKPDSLRVYGQRFRNGLSAYSDYLSSPMTWSYPSAETRSATTGSNGEARRAKSPKAKSAKTAAAASDSGPMQNEAGVPTISYPYPLRPGLIISVTLPADLTKQEAARIGTFLSSLAVDPQLALPAPRPNGEDGHQPA